MYDCEGTDYSDMFTRCLERGYVGKCIVLCLRSGNSDSTLFVTHVLRWCIRCNSMQGIDECHQALSHRDLVGDGQTSNPFPQRCVDALTWTRYCDRSCDRSCVYREISVDTLNHLSELLGGVAFMASILVRGIENESWLDTNVARVRSDVATDALMKRTLCKLRSLSESYNLKAIHLWADGQMGLDQVLTL